MHDIPSSHILVFDSGIGGMGAVQALRERSPSLHIDYLADNALFPYGEQPDDRLISRVVELLSQLCQVIHPDLVIIACNTASTLALPAVRRALPMPVVGCVPPIRWAGRVSQTRTIGLLATTATARRPYVADLHQHFAHDCQLIVHGSPTLACLAENAFRGDPITAEAVAKEVSHLFCQPGGNTIDTIGLGCTHYTFLMPFFERIHHIPPITWLDPAPAVAQHALHCLSRTMPHRPARPSCPRRFFMTKTPHHPDELLHHISRLGFDEWELFSPIPPHYSLANTIHRI